MCHTAALCLRRCDCVSSLAEATEEGKELGFGFVHEIRRASGFTSIKFLKYIDAGKLARMVALEAGGAMADSDGEGAGNGVPMLD